ncbi:MAG: hypothetical protein JO367_11175 [Actinobacteria bacterium]|nr:hypothetical protein [Actinomycetota bacterium]
MIDPHLPRRLHRPRRLLAALGVAGAALVFAGPVRADIPPAEVPPSMHGAVDTQALTLGNGAAALLVDPGTAYAYSTLDRDDYGGGLVSYTMTARGANLNLGALAYAAIWAAPSCDQKADPNAPNASCVLSGGATGTPDTGLEDAAGFPGYAEALYPPPPAPNPDRTSSYKCVVNKDSNGEAPTSGAAQSVCRAAGPGASDAVPLTAWGEVNGKEYRSTGFSRVAGIDIPGAIHVAVSESHSEVKAIGKNQLQSTGYSVLKDINIAGGQVHIDWVRSEGTIVSDPSGKATRSLDCRLGGLSIGGQGVALSGGELPVDQIQPMLDQVATATGYKVELVPPGTANGVQAGGKQLVSCTGLLVKFADTHTQSPVPVCLPPINPMVPSCVPALANREELHLGAITVQQSVNSFASGDNGTAVSGGTGAASGSEGSSGMSDALSGSVLGSTVTNPDTSSPSSSPASSESALPPSTSSGGEPQVSLNPPASSIPTELATKGRNLAAIGALTAAGGTMILLVALLLIAVVNAMATGTPLRLPFLGSWSNLPFR